MTHFGQSQVRDFASLLPALRRCREAGIALGLDGQAQAELGVAASEAVRTVLRHSAGAVVSITFGLESDGPVQTVVAALEAPIADPEAVTAELEDRSLGELVDLFRVEAGRSSLRIELGKALDAPAPREAVESLAQHAGALEAEPLDECVTQAEEIRRLVFSLLGKNREVAQLTDELEETNRGVVALYAELDEAARLWHTTFDAISAGVALLDGRGRVARVNAAMPRLLGCPLEEIIGRRPAEVLVACLGVRDLPDLRTPNSDATPRRFEVHSVEGWFALTLDPIEGASAGDRGAVLILDDITERKRLEEERQAAERAEHEATRLRAHARRMGDLERVKSDFLNLASHELRGPLSVLRGYMSMFEDGSLGKLTPGMERAMPVMVQKMREMNLLVNQMLETARIEDSRLILDIRELDLADVLREAEVIMEPLAAGVHELIIETPPEKVPVAGDQNRLTTIVTNLIDNAIKYSPAGGVVRVRLETDIDGREARVAVSDQGLGIADKDRGKLFTRFGRLVTQENSHIPGTGLGLYLARELARMHRGDIHLESRWGEGSEFTLVLPLADQGA